MIGDIQTYKEVNHFVNPFNIVIMTKISFLSNYSHDALTDSISIFID